MRIELRYYRNVVLQVRKDLSQYVCMYICMYMYVYIYISIDIDRYKNYNCCFAFCSYFVLWGRGCWGCAYFPLVFQDSGLVVIHPEHISLSSFLKGLSFSWIQGLACVSTSQHWKVRALQPHIY